MARTKTDLLDDAIDVLRTGGTLTIESLAQRAGLTKPGVLHHFPSKEALMEGLIERVRDDTGPYFRKALMERLAGHGIVGEVRTIGLMGAIEIVKDKETRERFPGDGAAAVVVRDHAIANGMMLRATGDTMILSPPLIWTRSTIDMAADRIARALDLAEADLRE